MPTLKWAIRSQRELTGEPPGAHLGRGWRWASQRAAAPALRPGPRSPPWPAAAARARRTAAAGSKPSLTAKELRYLRTVEDTDNFLWTLAAILDRGRMWKLAHPAGALFPMREHKTLLCHITADLGGRRKLSKTSADELFRF